MLIYINPSKEKIITDWPYSHALRTKVTFSVEQGEGKERAVRITINPKTGKANKPKKLTYARKVLFVDGSDGRTYIMQSVGWAISVMQSNMRYQQERIGVEDERYIKLTAMFDEEITATINVGE
jgi:hypothetical protein